jgi:chemotaxis protein MotB
MKSQIKLFCITFLGVGLLSCVSNKKFGAMQEEYENRLASANERLDECTDARDNYKNQLASCEVNLKTSETSLNLRQEQIGDLKAQLERQVTQVGDMAVLSQSANDNIKETLSQLEKKDKYIHLLQAAKSKADSINLALAVNLKSALKKCIEDEDVEIQVDKTVVMINLSDKMLYQSGSYKLTPRAHEVLEKIARIIESRPNLEVMVEGYTDNVPINTSCIQDNWDLSVKRSTSVVRALQEQFKVDPNRLIAAGRGEYNTLSSNATDEGRATNRRTRIIILPKLNQFYDLLNPDMAAAKTPG